jgi:hypothetical protein
MTLDSNVDARDDDANRHDLGRRVAPFAAGVVLPVAGLVAVLRCATSAFGGYWLDEVYTLALGRHRCRDSPPRGSAVW